MATPKKPVAKKSAPKKKAVVKKSAPRAVRTEVRSLRVAPLDTPFFTIRFTHQSLYWCILAVIVVALAAWVVWNSVRIDEIYNQIDAANLINDTIVQTKAVPTE